MAVQKRSNKLSVDPAGHTRKAYAGIRKMLFHNEIVPNQKISYRDLAERLGMSQTPVIQALKWLEIQQLVRHEPHRGYSIAPMSLQEVEEIYDLRLLVELDLLKSSIHRLNDSGITDLRTALERHLEAAQSDFIYDRLQRDMEFHLTLAALSGRHVQQNVLKNLFDLLYLKYGAKFLFTSSIQTAGGDHQELFECIKKQDLKGSRSVLGKHIRRVKRHVLKGVAQMEEAMKI
jgi:DNA-binding GntR family transcriptional regulator